MYLNLLYASTQMGTLRIKKERISHGARTVLYKEFLAERQEILRHKWIESEKAGYDIGFERALMDWTLKYRSGWLEKRPVVIRSPLAPLFVKAGASFETHNSSASPG